MNPDAIKTLIELAYIIAAIFFIVGIKKLGNAETARQGNRVSAIGMLIAVVATQLAARRLHFGVRAQ